jgi:hypothetical protein
MLKNKNQIGRYLLIFSLMGSYLLILIVAFAAYIYYGVVAKGILGFATMYLLFFFVRYSKIEVSIDNLQHAPKKGKYFAVAFAGGLVFCWAMMQFLEMILFFVIR